MREQENEQVPDATLSGLSPADAAAVDALIESGLDVTAASASDDEGRVRRVASLLDLLSVGAELNPSLADVTLARVMRLQREEARVGTGVGEPALTADDEEALEAWVMGGFDAQRVPPSLRERARNHEALAALVTAGPALGGMEALAERALAAVQVEIDREAGALDLRPVRRRTGIRLADLVSVAAVILIGCGVLFPVLGSMREQSRRAICQANLGSTATAMSTYAGSNRDALPMATASLGGGKWWDVGAPTKVSNSANLYTLARDGYLSLANLACPGNPAAPTGQPAPGAWDWRRLEEVSYSYQLVFGPRPAWNGGPRMPILADRSPVVLRAIRGEAIDPFANAPNHRGAGQHMLANDGSVMWATSPVLKNGDNIWLPRAVEARVRQMSGQSMRPLEGTELPGAVDDVVLGP